MLARIDAMIERLKALPTADFIAVFTHGQIMHFMRMRALQPSLTPAQMMRQFPLFAKAAPILNAATLRAQADENSFALDTHLYELE